MFGRLNRKLLLGLGLALVALGGLIVLAAIGISQARATRTAYVVTAEVQPGDTFTSNNVQKIQVPDSGDYFVILTNDPTHSKLDPSKGMRASHHLAAQTVLTPDDVMDNDYSLVQIQLAGSPAITAGQTIDIYAVADGKNVMVGRKIRVHSSAGGAIVIESAKKDEPDWIALSSGRVALYAASSDGVDVPDTQSGLLINDAVTQLAGIAVTGTVQTLPSPSPSDQASPGSSPSPSPSGSPKSTPKPNASPTR